MSEYQHYEFLAVDHRLDKVAQAKLRRISSRARISATSFVKHYNWGDLDADPVKLLERYFDLFLYEANWGTRRFAMRVPRGAIDLGPLRRYDLDEMLQVKRSGTNLVIDITRHEVEPGITYFRDEARRLPDLAPFRAALIDGDRSLISLIWLIAVDWGLIEDADMEPLPIPGKASSALSQLAAFFAVDPDLVAAAFGAKASSRVKVDGTKGSGRLRTVADLRATADRIAFSSRVERPHVHDLQ